jgi:hypothetical protein
VLLRLAPRIIIMKTLIVWILWCLLFVLCWPMALLLLALIPIVWLIALPFRVVGITVGAVFALIRAILYLPARLLGGQKRI